MWGSMAGELEVSSPSWPAGWSILPFSASFIYIYMCVCNIDISIPIDAPPLYTTLETFFPPLYSGFIVQASLCRARFPFFFPRRLGHVRDWNKRSQTHCWLADKVGSNTSFLGRILFHPPFFFDFTACYRRLSQFLPSSPPWSQPTARQTRSSTRRGPFFPQYNEAITYYTTTTTSSIRLYIFFFLIIIFSSSAGSSRFSIFFLISRPSEYGPVDWTTIRLSTRIFQNKEVSASCLYLRNKVGIDLLVGGLKNRKQLISIKSRKGRLFCFTRLLRKLVYIIYLFVDLIAPILAPCRAGWPSSLFPSYFYFISST